jgi:hypothetical protein
VKLDPAWHRGGLLGQASILTVTSYGNHTSVVKRGKWVLENLLAAAPPAAAARCARAAEAHDGHLLTARQQLDYRANPSCAACHVRMDPMGFSLENYRGGRMAHHGCGPADRQQRHLPDGTRFAGLPGLQRSCSITAGSSWKPSPRG